MEDVLTSPLWSVIGVVFAILTVLVTVGIFFAQRKTKKLSYDIVSNTQLVGLKGEIQGKVQILYEGKEVENVQLYTLRFVNSGNQSISSSDYERPVSIEVDSGSKFLTYEVVDEHPENLGVNLSLNKGVITINPVLLNGKDTFSIKTLISDFNSKPNIDGRINGVKSISLNKEGQLAFSILVLLSLVLLASAAPFLKGGGEMSIFGYEVVKEQVGVVLFGLGYGSMLVGVFMNKRLYKVLRDHSRSIVRSFLS